MQARMNLPMPEQSGDVSALQDRGHDCQTVLLPQTVIEKKTEEQKRDVCTFRQS